MLTQTKQAIRDLRNAGLERKDFSVNCQRDYVGKHPDTGKPMYEYGDLLIVLFCSKDKAISMSQAFLDNGFSVIHMLYQSHDGKIKLGHPRVKHDYKGKLQLWDMTKTDKNPYGLISDTTIEHIKHLTESLSGG